MNPHGPHHGDLVLSEVSICASPTLDILGAKVDSRLTVEDNVPGNMQVLSPVSLKELIF